MLLITKQNENIDKKGKSRERLDQDHNIKHTQTGRTHTKKRPVMASVCELSTDSHGEKEKRGRAVDLEASV